MKSLIVANWKAHKNIKETVQWLQAIKTDLEEQTKFEIVICPSFISLPLVFSLISGTSLKLGAQDVSQVEAGAYSGEVIAPMLSGLVSYTLLGHSERRRYFGETDEAVVKKIELCQKYQIKPIVCVENLEQVKILESGIIVAYEPPGAISTSNGGPDTPKNAVKFAQEVKKILTDETSVLYGGSVESQNVSGFLAHKELFGVLVGQASLDPQEFLKLVKNASLV